MKNSIKLFITLLTVFIFSCAPTKKEPENKITILPKEKSDKILKKEKPVKPKLKTTTATKVEIKTSTGKEIKLGSSSYKNLEKNLKNKKKKEGVKIKKTLDDLEFLKYKTDATKKFEKENILKNKSKNEIELHISDKIKSMFKPIINNYSLRHLQFENEGNRIELDTITLSYENKNKRIRLEILPLSIKPLAYIQQKHKDFFYKNYKLNNMTLHFSINYKLKLINGVFNHLNYTWVVTSQNISDMSDIIDIIRNINFNLFMELKKEYEKE